MKVSIIIANFNKKTMILQPWNHAYKVAKELASLGYNVTLFTNCQSNLSLQDSLTGICLQILPCRSLRFLNRKSVEVLRRERPDVIYWFGNSLSGIYLRRLRTLRIPIVLHISAVHYSLRDLKSLSPREIFSHWLHVVTSIPPGNLFVRLLNDNIIAAIIVPSKASRNRLCDLGVSGEKIKVAPLAFDAKDLTLKKPKTMLDAREELGLEKKCFLVTYLGSPDTIRGTDVLIRSANIIKSKLKNFKIIILSRRDSEKNIKDERLLLRLVRKYKLDNLVKIVPGRLNREIIKSYLLASNVIVFPFKITLSEPPLAILEAMAIGKPIVATETCGLPELIGSDRGLLVKPSDPEKLAQALYYLARNPKEADRLGRRAKEYVENLPDWRNLAKWTAEELSKVVQKKS